MNSWNDAPEIAWKPRTKPNLIMRESDSIPEHGVERGATRVVPYQTEWLEAFRSERKRIVRAIANEVPIEHVGSTAIPGLEAKPLIDIMLGFRDDTEATLCRQALLDLEYDYKGNPFTPDDHIFMLTEGGILHTYKVHLTPYDGAEWRRKLDFRDHLIANTAAARSYGQLKVKLARRFPGDRREYQRHKGNFIASLLKTLE